MVAQRFLVSIFTALALIIAPLSDSLACTTVSLGTPANPRIAKSYDWHDGTGLVMLNPRGVDKRAFLTDPKESTAQWRAHYASLTFTQFSREFALGGINEKGLVIEIMWYGRSDFPSAAEDPNPAIAQVQWIQYILDTSADLDEAEMNARKVRVVPLRNIKVHYLVCDASGACSAFEYLNKKLVISSGLGVRALTNNSFPESARGLAGYQGFGGKQAIPESGTGSMERFVIASSAAMTSARLGTTSEQAFATLDRVFTAGFTKWNIVYEPKTLKVHFRTVFGWGVKTIDFAKLVSHCAKSGTKVVDLKDPALASDPNRAFKNYESLDIRSYLAGTYTVQLHPELLDQLVAYPAANTACATAH